MDAGLPNNVAVIAMNIHEESKLLASAYGDGSIVIWDLEDFKLLKHLQNLHETEIT
jgi:WD40 repeat protein